jgi:hypothetical protein
MKKTLTYLFISITGCMLFLSQSVFSQGKSITEIFTDFHYNLKDSSKTTGFGLNRAYLGYNFLPAGNFSGTIILNIGSPDELAPGSVRRRYSYFREASVTYAKDNLTIALGITGTRLFDFQQRFWGKRYVANTYQSINGYGYIADLGVVVDYKFNDIWMGDITVMNGEGYSDLQLDNGVKTSAGITFTPIKQVAIRLYGDVENPKNRWRYTFVGFAGFKNDLITIGGEISYRSKLDKTPGHNAWGISCTGGITIFKKTELFARYDYSASVILPGEDTQWNWLNDGQFAVYGLQYTFNDNVKMALNYQGTYPYNNNKQDTNAVFVNAAFKF